MNVAFVTNVVHPEVKGGAQRRVHEIGRRLAADGHEVTVYARHYWDGPRRIEREGMYLQAIAPARELYAGERRSISEAVAFAVRTLPTLRRRWPAHDVVVASQFPYFPVLAASVAGLGRETPLVVTWHEVWADYWSEYLGRLAPGGWVIERLTAAVPHHPVAVSGVTADRLGSIGPDRDEIAVVPNGIDVAAIEAVEPHPGGHDVLYVGRLAEHKNVDRLLAAFERVVDEHDATLGVVGDGPEADRLRARAAESDVADYVDFLGFVEADAEVYARMWAAETFVSLSTREGFGITLAEAMAADCTVIAADHPESAASEVVGDAGFLVEPTVEAATVAIDRVLSGARPDQEPTTAVERYDWDVVAERALEVYRTATE